jgi:transcriptional regulator with XRE-family HTH domain
MSAGQAVAQAREEKNITQEQLALELYCSREAVSKYENGKRKIPKDLMPRLSQILDDPFLCMELALEATGRIGLPVLNGDFIEKHPAAMKDLVEKETAEALDHLGRLSVIKPLHLASSSEKEEIKRVVFELWDAATSINNLAALLIKKCGFSAREANEQWKVTLKARGMKK